MSKWTPYFSHHLKLKFSYLFSVSLLLGAVLSPQDARAESFEYHRQKRQEAHRLYYYTLQRLNNPSTQTKETLENVLLRESEVGAFNASGRALGQQFQQNRLESVTPEQMNLTDPDFELISPTPEEIMSTSLDDEPFDETALKDLEDETKGKLKFQKKDIENAKAFFESYGKKKKWDQDTEPSEKEIDQAAEEFLATQGIFKNGRGLASKKNASSQSQVKSKVEGAPSYQKGDGIISAPKKKAPKVILDGNGIAKEIDFGGSEEPKKK